jgi:SagB-type dehydrogenase family enzyme
MKKFFLACCAAALIFCGAAAFAESIKLPAPDIKGGAPFNSVVQSRRSVRDYKEVAISLQDLAQLLWSAQGVTDPKTGHRAAPSAVASYPLKLYAVVKPGGVTGLDAGVYLYEPKDHSLAVVKKGDLYPELLKAVAFFNKWISKTDVVFIFTGSGTFMTRTVEESGWMFVDEEGGMASENLLLQAVSMGLAGCPAGGFTDKKVGKILGLDEKSKTLLVVPVGKPE